MKVLFALGLFLALHFASCEIALPENSRLVLSSAELLSAPCTIDQALSCTKDCKGLNICFAGEKLILDCEKQQKKFCNPETLTCDATEAKCPLDEPVFRCPGVGLYPHLTNCKKLYVCDENSNRALEAECINNLIFDVRTRTCVSKSVCTTFTTTAGPCVGQNNTFITHPADNNLYVFCNGDNPKLGQCPVGFIFKSGCVFECKSNNIFPDPEDESCYFVCNNLLNPTRYCCSEGTIYDPSNKSCKSLKK